MQPVTDLDQEKRALRSDAAKRRKVAAAAGGDAGEALAGRFLDAVPLPADAAVSGYWPIRTEIDLLPLLGQLAARGHRLALPVVAGEAQPLVFRRWREGDAMAEGPYGIREPLDGAPAVDPDVLLVPLLAFDRAGYRLGYGGGFYDRSLAGLRARKTVTAVGVAWAAQEVDAVPHDGRDQPLDWIVTEREAIRIAGGAA
jgi:5-formyltetrahydrofolate cyclo-ligase